MRIVPDNDVIGAVAAIRRILTSPTLAPLCVTLNIEFIEFRDLGLQPNSTDREVWLACQATNVLLITGNRAGGEGSLDHVIRELGDVRNLPVLTIADAQELLNDRFVVEAAALALLDYVERIETLRGAGRIFIP
jgi:hypothetical protein